MSQHIHDREPDLLPGDERPSAWEQLPPGEREALEIACQPGETVLELIVQEGMHSPKLATMLHRFADPLFSDE